MPVSRGFQEAVAEVLAFTPQLRLKRMFGGVGVFASELMFALVVDDELFFKTDAETRPLFEAVGCAPWTYRRADGQPRDMGYLRAPDVIWDDPDEARRWSGLARAAALRKAAPELAAKRRL